MKQDCKYTSIGGQAVIEGVMMRSPHFVAVAVRKPDKKIVIRTFSFESVMQKYRWLKQPLLRGVITLVESMFQGIDALSYSANVASDTGKEQEEELSGWAIAGSIVSAFILGLGLFVALPHVLTALLVSNKTFGITADSPIFHLLDGVLKMGILLAYVYLIALMKDIHRVFQYHGAEHKVIFSFEKAEELTVENARKHSTLHPRCGTSFLLFLVLISIVVFSVVFPFFNLTTVFKTPILNHILMVFVKILLMFPVAGLSYEFIKMCAGRMDRALFRSMIWPGLILQKLTTREPDDSQLEIALASMRQVLRLEKGGALQEELEIGQLSELGGVQARLAEFPET